MKIPYEIEGVLREIANERYQQLHPDGTDPTHSDMHDDGDHAKAAVCYVMNSLDDPRPVFCGKPCRGTSKAIPLWPWPQSWWTPGKPRRNLIVAAALIVAEIERIDRDRLGEKMSREYIESETEHMRNRESD